MSKTLVRSLAVLVCLGILAAAVPFLNSAVKSTTKQSFIQIVKQPSLVLSSLVPVLNPGQTTVKVSAQTPSRVRPTGDIPVPRPGTGD